MIPRPRLTLLLILFVAFVCVCWNILRSHYTRNKPVFEDHKYLRLNHESNSVMKAVTKAAYNGTSCEKSASTSLSGIQNSTPSISLFMRMSGKREDHKTRFYCNMLNTVLLFWPASLGKMVIVLDEEVEEDHTFGNELLKQTTEYFPNFSFEVKYEQLPKDESVLNFPGQLKSGGYNRQLWSSFLTDLYTSDDIIGWLDNDSPFLLPVALPTIMTDGKVRILGSGCTMGISWVKSWARSTEKAIGFPQVADFMTYFPVYMYRDTFTRCRKYILKRFNTDSFEEAFKKFYNTGTGYISPVSVIVSYAWYFEKDRYSWNIKICGDLNVYNNRFPEGYKIRPEHVRNVLTQPQTAYHGPLESNDFYAKIVPISYCLSQAAAGIKPERCKKHQAAEINVLFNLFKADMHSIRKDNLHPCIGDYTEKCLHILHCYIESIGEEIKSSSRKLVWENFDKVGTLSRMAKIECPAHPV